MVVSCITHLFPPLFFWFCHTPWSNLECDWKVLRIVLKKFFGVDLSVLIHWVGRCKYMSATDLTWLGKQSGARLDLCTKQGIPVLSFLEPAELVLWELVHWLKSACLSPPLFHLLNCFVPAPHWFCALPSSKRQADVPGESSLFQTVLASYFKAKNSCC